LKVTDLKSGIEDHTFRSPNARDFLPLSWNWESTKSYIKIYC